MRSARRTAGRWLAAGWVIVLLGVAGPAAAQGPRPMSLVDLLDVPRLGDPQLSPDGRRILFVRTEADWAANRRIDRIWRADVDGAEPRQLTRGPGGERSPRWSPDGETIAFVARRGGEDPPAQIWLLPNRGGEAQPLTDHETAVSAIAWAPDGGSLYFLADDPKPAEVRARERAQDDVFAFDEDYQQRHLWRVDVATKAATRVTEGDFSVIGYTLSRDGTRIAHHRGPTPLIGDNEAREVWVMAADGSGGRRVTDNRAIETDAELSPDNRRLLFLAAANERFETPYNTNVFVVPMSGGEARLLTGDFPHQVERATWSADGQAIVVVANMGVRSELFRLDVAGGEARRLTEGDHRLYDWHYASALDRHLFIADRSEHPGEVWTLGPGEAAPRRLTDVFGDLAERFVLPDQVRVEWSGADGTPVEGLLYYPLDYRPGTRYPLVVQTHGGPHASDRFGFGAWRDYIPVLAAKGYAVLKPNYRGSTGYGDRFLRDMVGGYFRNAHLDVLAGVDAVIEMGVADPDRLAKMGWSAGGHMTNKIITVTDRFKAAASGAGASNWISMYGQSDVRSYRTPWFGGTPWERDAPIDVYWDHSPLKDAARVVTPTIFLVGERDARVPPEQSVEMHRALKANGVATHLYIAPREPHGWNELRHALFKMNVELAWFEAHVTDRPYTWEEAPGPAPDAEEAPESTAAPLPTSSDDAASDERHTAGARDRMGP